MNKPLTHIAITAGLLAALTGAAWAQAPAAKAQPCNCEGAAAPAAADHAINTKGTGTNNGITARASPAQQAAPAASSAGGTTEKPGHVTINR